MLIDIESIVTPDMPQSIYDDVLIIVNHINQVEKNCDKEEIDTFFTSIIKANRRGESEEIKVYYDTVLQNFARVMLDWDEPVDNTN